MNYGWMDSPFGPLLLVADGAGLKRVQMNSAPSWLPPANWQEGGALFEQGARELREYFAGQRRHFEVALAAEGTAFQHAVWQALLAIPFGATASYRDIAHAIGKPSAVRAVGAANGANPLAIIVPCHRVIGANGTLTGYAGGLANKAQLLRHEGWLG